MEIFKNKFKRNKQSGVTLLLSILILAAVMAISFSLTTILFVELRSSSDLLKTESSLHGATGIGEQALFNLKKGACLNNSPSCYEAVFDNQVKLLADPQIVINNNPIINDKVIPGSLFTSTSQVYDFCGTSVIYDGDGLVEGCGYGKVTVNYVTTNNSTDPIYAYLCEWDPNTNYSGNDIPCSSISYSSGHQPYWKGPCTNNCGTGIQEADGSVMLNPGTSNTASWTIDPTKQQQLIITNPTATADVYYSVITYASGGVTPKGLPYVGKTSINIATKNGSTGRKIQVTVPNNGVAAPYVNTTNYAAEVNGATTSSSSEYWNFPSGSTINGDRTGLNWGNVTGGWNDSTAFTFPDWLQIDFDSAKNLSEVNVYTLGNTWPVTPNATTPATTYGLLDFEVQYDNGSGWATVPGGSVVGNTLMWRRFAFPTINGVTRIRIYVTDARVGHARIIEVEAY